MKTTGLNQSIYFLNVLTFKKKSKNMILWRGHFTFISTGNERLWDHSNLVWIRLDWGRPPPRNSDYRYKEINLEELQDTWCIFYLLKHKISSLTDLYTMHSLLVLMQIDKLPFKVYIFLNQRDQTSIKTDGPVIQHPEQLQDCCLKRSSLTEYSREDLTIILIFSSFPQDYQGPKTTGSSLENNTHVPKRWVMDIII